MNAKGCKSRIKAFIRTGLCLSVVCLFGCRSFTGKTPDWVRNPKSVYPENQYLVAVGEGDTRRSAENSAAANLSRIFESHIESDERVVDKVSETDKDFSRTTDLTTDINILSAQTLINIQHAEAWKDDTGRYHAVAYLDRRDTAAIYRDKVEEQTNRVQALLGYAAHAANPLEKFALLRAAARAASENELLLRQLKVIHPPTASASAPPYSINEIQKTATESAKQIYVQILIEGDEDGRMTNCLQELVTGFGFVVGKPPVLGMTGRVSIADTGVRTAGLAFFNYNLTVQMQDIAGNVLTTLAAKGREAVGSPDRARERCYRTMENVVISDGVRRLNTYFDSLVQQAQ